MINRENDVFKERVYDKCERKDDESILKVVFEKGFWFRDRWDERWSSLKCDLRI